MADTKQKPATEIEVVELATGKVVRDVSRDFGTEGGVHRQLWKVCDTCNKAHLYGLEHRYEDEESDDAKT